VSLLCRKDRWSERLLTHSPPCRSVDDESKPERRTFRKFPKASEWNFTTSPPYSYWLYYMYANMGTLVRRPSLRPTLTPGAV
jgi:adenosine deaminase